MTSANEQEGGRFWNGGRPLRAVTSSGARCVSQTACPFKNSRAQLSAIRSTARRARDYRLDGEKRGKTRQRKRSRQHSPIDYKAVSLPCLSTILGY